MKRYGGLWESVVAWPNLVRAAAKAQRGKRDQPAVQQFNFSLEYQLYRLADELGRGSYRPGTFRSHWIKRPKARLISAAPYRDRVVHHALMNVLEPILDRQFHPGSYACRRGKGTHAAADRLQVLMRRNRHFIQCDVRKFFPSIDHEVLKEKYRRLIKDRRLLELMDRIVDGSNQQESVADWFDGDDLFAPGARRRGLPIGNLTSQWFANWMLNDLDHLVTSGLGIGAFVRYCDDFILLHDDPAVLREAAGRIVALLARDRLRLHAARPAVRMVSRGARFVGFRLWPTHRWLAKQNVRALRRRVRWMKRAYAEATIDAADVRPRLVSWLGHARQADSAYQIRQLGREWTFVRGGVRGGEDARGGAERLACPARGLVEQQTEEVSFRVPQQERARQPEQQHWVPGRAALLTVD